MRLIDADALLRSTDKEAIHAWEIALAPTVDPVKHGHWIVGKGGDYIGYPIYEYSECGCPVGEDASNYCPYCGAKMDEEG